MERIPLLTFAVTPQFACAKEGCVHSCCAAHWQFYMDREHFQQLHALPDSNPIKLQVQRNMRRVHGMGEPDPLHYAIIKNHGGRCAFLDDCGLCSIWAALGPDAMGDACLAHPMFCYGCGASYYLGMLPSCEAAAKLLLQNEEGLDFCFVEDNGECPTHAQDSAGPGTLAEHFDKLMDFSITLLQNRQYRIWERMALLGMFFQRLAAADTTVVEGLIDEWNTRLSGRALKEGLGRLSPHHEIHLILASAAAHPRMEAEKQEGLDAEFANACHSMFGGLGMADGTPEENEQKLAAYERAYNGLYLPFLNQNEYLMENFMVAALFNNALRIFTNTQDAFAGYRLLSMYFGVARLFLVAAAEREGGLSKELFIETAAMVARHFEPTQNSVLFMEVPRILQALNITSQAWYIGLVQD